MYLKPHKLKVQEKDIANEKVREAVLMPELDLENQIKVISKYLGKKSWSTIFRSPQ